MIEGPVVLDASTFFAGSGAEPKTTRTISFVHSGIGTIPWRADRPSFVVAVIAVSSTWVLSLDGTTYAQAIGGNEAKLNLIALRNPISQMRFPLSEGDLLQSAWGGAGQTVVLVQDQ